MKRLVVNADDLGLCEAVNRGILRAAREGLVTSASLMANGRAAEDAIERLRECPSLDVGIHLVLVEERPVSDAKRLTSLVSANGRLPRTWQALLGRLAVSRAALREAEWECRAQIERALAAGITPSHLDSHQHVHAFPPLWSVVARLASAYNIPWIRGLRGACSLVVPSHRSPASPSRNTTSVSEQRRRVWRTDETVHWSRRPLMAAACAMAWSSRRGESAVRADATTMGVVESGHLTEPVLLRLIDRVPDGVTELVCHPGDADPGKAGYGHWGYHWPEDLAALTSAAAHALVRRRGITLTTFRSVADAQKAPVRRRAETAQELSRVRS